MNFFEEGERLKAMFDSLVKQHKKSKRRIVDNKNVSMEMVTTHEKARVRLMRFFEAHSRFIRPRKNSLGVFSVDDFVNIVTREAGMHSRKTLLDGEEMGGRARFPPVDPVEVHWSPGCDGGEMQRGPVQGGHLRRGWGMPAAPHRFMGVRDMGHPGGEFFGHQEAERGYGMHVPQMFAGHRQGVGGGMARGNRMCGVYGEPPKEMGIGGCGRGFVGGMPGFGPGMGEGSQIQSGGGFPYGMAGAHGGDIPGPLAEWSRGGHGHDNERGSQGFVWPTPHYPGTEGHGHLAGYVGDRGGMGFHELERRRAAEARSMPSGMDVERHPFGHPGWDIMAEMGMPANDNSEAAFPDDVPEAKAGRQKGGLEQGSGRRPKKRGLGVVGGGEWRDVKKEASDGPHAKPKEWPEIKGSSMCPEAGPKIRTIEDVIGGDTSIDTKTKAFIYELCDGFIDHMIHMSCALAYHRKEDAVGECDVKLALKTEVGVELPGDGLDVARDALGGGAKKRRRAGQDEQDGVGCTSERR